VAAEGGAVDARVLDEAGLAAWGAAFARELRPPAVVGLSGELGSGKTTLVRAIAAALGVTASVTSPTFALVHRYDGGRGPVYHLDAYRIRRPQEALDLGLDDMLVEAGAVILIEWPERLGSALPPLTHRIGLAYAGDDPLLRRVEVA
jgi:tRNA threonylcarbamoyladenosine biosynthesis protein TsaE